MAILLDLIAVSDVVLENFTPRVTRRFGLDYPNLRAVKPDLVLVSNTGYGHSGPWSDFGAMASALEPTHGSGAFMGYLEPAARRQSGGQFPTQQDRQFLHRLPGLLVGATGHHVRSVPAGHDRPGGVD